MAVKRKTYKPLTKKEKEFRKSIKKQLVEQGVIPPPKPRLNRLKFAKETKQEFEENIGCYGDITYLFEAIGCMLPSEYKGKVSPEELGVLKMMKLAIDIKKWKENLRESGQKQYKVGDFYDQVIAPILRL